MGSLQITLINVYNMTCFNPASKLAYDGDSGLELCCWKRRSLLLSTEEPCRESSELLEDLVVVNESNRILAKRALFTFA